MINLIWLLNCLLTILFYPKGISTETGVSAEVFGIDIVHAVEFSKIGCFWLHLSNQLQSNFTILVIQKSSVNPEFPRFFRRFLVP